MITVERRKSKRWVAAPGVFLKYRHIRKPALLRGKHRLFGVVVDISRGGLSAEYPGATMRPTENAEYAVSVPKTGLWVEGIRLLVVSDFLSEHEPRCGDTVCRRRGFSFGPLNPAQKELIDYLIRRHTVSSPRP